MVVVWILRVSPLTGFVVRSRSTRHRLERSWIRQSAVWPVLYEQVWNRVDEVRAGKIPTVSFTPIRALMVTTFFFLKFTSPLNGHLAADCGCSRWMSSCRFLLPAAILFHFTSDCFLLKSIDIFSLFTCFTKAGRVFSFIREISDVWACEGGPNSNQSESRHIWNRIRF